MKKVNIILFLMVALILLPLSVKADMGVPEIQPYEVIVNKATGINYYVRGYDSELQKEFLKEKGVLEYDTRIKIRYEEEINGEVYGEFEIKNEDSADSYLVKLQDIVLLNETYIIDEENDEDFTHKLDEELVATVLKDNGIVMRKGPASVYSSIGEVIPKGTKLSITHNSGVWYYTEYNGVKGWVCELHGEIGFYTKETLFVSKDLNITSNDSSWFGENEEPLSIKGTIPANTLIKEFYMIDAWSWGYYVTYNGISGYIDKNSVCYGDINEETEITTKINKTLYEAADKSSKIVEKIPANTKIKFKCGIGHNVYDWIYVKYNDKIGWLEYNPPEFDDEYSEEDIITSTTTTTPTTTKSVIINEKEKISAKELIYICIGGAVIISLTAVVTIILINKSKKFKNEEIINDTQE